MFDQLHAYLEALEAGKDAQVTTHLLEMMLWQRTALGPQLYACVSCMAGRTS